MSASPTSRSYDAIFLSAHPDDAELFCGGTVAKMAADGHQVMLVDLTAGELSSNGDVPTRRRESLEASRILGAGDERVVLGLPDGGISENDSEQLAAVVNLLRELRPRLVIAPYPRDRHPDHEACGRLARRAMFFAGISRFPGGGEPLSGGTLLYYPCHYLVAPSFYLDVSGVMQQRRDAIESHASQFEPGEGKRDTLINRSGFLEGIEARLRQWGMAAGVEYAEGFVFEQPPLLKDLLGVVNGRRM